MLFASPNESDDEDDHQFMLEEAYFKYVLGESDEEVEMPENLSVAAQYMEDLLATRFAPPRHPPDLEDDYRAKSHAQYGMHSVAMRLLLRVHSPAVAGHAESASVL